MKREMAALLEEASRLHPVVLFLDDLHWGDASTVDLLGYLADRLTSMRLLIVATFRPSELAQARHPFLSLKLDLQARGVCREISLEYLSAEAVASYVALECPGHALPGDLLGLIHQRTEGHALFLVDLIRDLKRRGAIAKGARGECVLVEGLSALERELPESVRSMIERKLGALGNSDRQLLSAAAVQGGDFCAAVVAQALDLDEAVVEDALDRLERDHALVRFVGELTCPDRTITPRYRFAHSLYREALTGTLRATRRGALAGEIAGALVQRWADRTPEIALDLAVLFETARAPLAAARYFSVAAQSASRLYAHQESRGLAERGLALLASVPDDSVRRGVELELHDDARTRAQDSAWLRGAGSGPGLSSCARAQPPGAGSGTGHPRADGPVGALHRWRRNRRRVRAGRAVAGAGRPRQRPSCADDRRVVRRRGAAPQRLAAPGPRASRPRASALRPGVSQGARVAGRHRAGDLLPVRSGARAAAPGSRRRVGRWYRPRRAAGACAWPPTDAGLRVALPHVDPPPARPGAAGAGPARGAGGALRRQEHRAGDAVGPARVGLGAV